MLQAETVVLTVTIDRDAAPALEKLLDVTMELAAPCVYELTRRPATEAEGYEYRSAVVPD